MYKEVEYDINVRWETFQYHRPESESLFKKVMDIDFFHGGDFFCWKKGGDGDNGEHFMYELDIVFDEEDMEKFGKIRFDYETGRVIL